MITPVILCGGSGTRLWPLSRTLHPKQFLPLCSSESMLQETVGRLDGLELADLHIICNEEHRFLVAEQMREIEQVVPQIILEPVGRNTAPAIALAALDLMAQAKGDSVMLVLAADHRIEDTQAFQKAVAAAQGHAEKGYLVTFGITPTYASTAYGYIQAGNQAVDGCAEGLPVQAFVEKPDQVTADAYYASNKFYWNSGMFMFRADRYIEELEKNSPEILNACKQAMSSVSKDLDFMRIDAEAFAACPEDSIDYAVMEKTDRAVVIPLDAGWSDVGSWSSLWEVQEKDANNNVIKGDAIVENTTNSFVFSEERLITTLGVDKLIIVDTKDALLVAHKDQVQEVKKIVEQIKLAGRQEHINHREVYRPWGKYDSIDAGHQYQVKRITVKPGQKLSLQRHQHRAEHWIVVKGIAEVRCGDTTQTLGVNESTYIPLGELHQLGNPGELPLEIIEVQSGGYLGEDDIIRYEDRYGRADENLTD